MSEGAINEIVKEANQEVKACRLRVDVLTRMVNSREETRANILTSIVHQIR